MDSNTYFWMVFLWNYILPANVSFRRKKRQISILSLFFGKYIGSFFLDPLAPPFISSSVFLSHLSFFSSLSSKQRTSSSWVRSSLLSTLMLQASRKQEVSACIAKQFLFCGSSSKALTLETRGRGFNLHWPYPISQLCLFSLETNGLAHQVFFSSSVFRHFLQIIRVWCLDEFNS